MSMTLPLHYLNKQTDFPQTANKKLYAFVDLFQL